MASRLREVTVSAYPDYRVENGGQAGAPQQYLFGQDTDAANYWYIPWTSTKTKIHEYFYPDHVFSGRQDGERLWCLEPTGGFVNQDSERIVHLRTGQQSQWTHVKFFNAIVPDRVGGDEPGTYKRVGFV